MRSDSTVKMTMLSPREIPMRSRPTKPKILTTRSLQMNRYGGHIPRTDHVTGANGQENPCQRRMRELNTIEIRNKHTKEIVDLEVRIVVVNIHMYLRESTQVWLYSYVSYIHVCVWQCSINLFPIDYNSTLQTY